MGLYSTFYYAGGSVGAALPASVECGRMAGVRGLVLTVQVSTYALAMMFWTPTRDRWKRRFRMREGERPDLGTAVVVRGDNLHKDTNGMKALHD